MYFLFLVMFVDVMFVDIFTSISSKTGLIWMKLGRWVVGQERSSNPVESLIQWLRVAVLKTDDFCTVYFLSFW